MSNSTHQTFGVFIRQPGLVLATASFSLGLVWMAVIQPLEAPDELGHFQAINAGAQATPSSRDTLGSGQSLG
jgi:hypothetical protein